MKKIFYFTIAAVAMFVFTLGSCKKEIPQQSVQTTSTTSSIKNSFAQVKDGRLVFKSMADLKTQVVALNVRHEEIYESWQSSINFKSYRTLERRAILTNWNNYYVKKDTLAPLATYIEVPEFCLSVLNEYREVMVNDSVYFYNGSNLYIISYENEIQLKAIEKSIDNQIANGNTVTQKSVASNVRYVQLKFNKVNFTNQGNLKNGPSNMPNSYETSSPYWIYNGMSFKFWVKIQWSNYGGFDGITMAVSNYLVYWHNNKGCWLIAGEGIWKTYTAEAHVVLLDGGFNSLPFYLPYELDNTFASETNYFNNAIYGGFSMTGCAQNSTNYPTNNQYLNTNFNLNNGIY